MSVSAFAGISFVVCVVVVVGELESLCSVVLYSAQYIVGSIGPSDCGGLYTVFC